MPYSEAYNAAVPGCAQCRQLRSAITISERDLSSAAHRRAMASWDKSVSKLNAIIDDCKLDLAI